MKRFVSKKKEANKKLNIYNSIYDAISNSEEGDRILIEEDKYEESPDYKEAVKNSNHSYDNTLIERDIKDPSPTINASFRIIGRTERSSFNYKTSNNDEPQYEGAFEFEEDFDEQFVKNETINQPNPIMSDWDDETYSAW